MRDKNMTFYVWEEKSKGNRLKNTACVGAKIGKNPDEMGVF